MRPFEAADWPAALADYDAVLALDPSQVGALVGRGRALARLARDEEAIEALSTPRLSLMDFLVLPRMLALILMMPLLSVYADLMGILGGAIVGIGMLDLTLVEYLRQTQSAVTMTDFLLGMNAAQVVRHALCSVLVVREEPPHNPWAVLP